MAIVRLTDKSEQGSNIYYEFDPSTKPLGEGGMGKVFRGKRVDAVSGVTREVAIKFMFDDLPQSIIERARREANIKIKHENLVEMMGFFTTENPGTTPGSKRLHYHVVSELLDGVVLSDLIDGVTVNQDGEKITYAVELLQLFYEDPKAFAIKIVKSVLSGVISLHENGYIHRDIDPSNIMVTRDRKIKLIDFGIAKKVKNLATQDKSLTATGQFMGKPQYAAPELVLGDVANQNKTTDIYAIGMMLYQLITGKMPFSGTASEIISAQLRKNLPIKNVPYPLARKIILKATNKKQDQRYQSAAAFFVAVEQWENYQPSGWDKIKEQIFTKRAGIVLLALLIVGGLVAFLPGLLSNSEDPKAPVVDTTSVAKPIVEEKDSDENKVVEAAPKAVEPAAPKAVVPATPKPKPQPTPPPKPVNTGSTPKPKPNNNVDAIWKDINNVTVE